MQGKLETSNFLSSIGHPKKNVQQYVPRNYLKNDLNIL